MSTDTNVKQVIINKLTKAQYDAAEKSATELYLTPDDPASATNLGPVMVDGTTIKASSDGTIYVDQTQLTTKQNTLSNMSVSEGTTGTATTQRTMRADYLKQIIEAYIAAQATMTGATSSAAGAKGLVPAPAAGDEAKFLRGDGTWVGSTSAAVWGSLTGTLSDQTDLQTALNAKQGTLSTAQLNAANSGITSTKVGNYDTHIANSDIHVTTANKTTWNGKQDAISDLATIRSGASAGATAVQPGSLATVATSGSYNDLSNKPTIPTVDQTYSASSTNAQSGTAVASAISGKVDIADLSQVECIVETYSSGTSWYRIYSDGWCEQGGIADRGNSDTVSLLVPMADTNYHITIMSRNGYQRYAWSWDIATNQFKFSAADDNTQNNDGIFSWKAEGYMA